MKNHSIPKELKQMVAGYDPKTQELCFYLRDFMLECFPEAHELIYDAYNAVSVVFSLSDKLSDAYCHIAVYSSHVNLGFNRGVEIPEPEIELAGTGKLIRHFKVRSKNELPREKAAKTVAKAIDIAFMNNPKLDVNELSHKVSIMPTSGKKVRPIYP